MAENEDDSDGPPGAFLAQHVPERFLGHVGIPNHEVLAEVDIRREDREGEEQGAEEVILFRAHRIPKQPLPVQDHGDHVGRSQGHPGAPGKVIDAIHGGEPLVLQGLHPHDRPKREREPESPYPPRRVEPHAVGAPGGAVLILLQRPIPQPRGEQRPGAEAGHGRQVKARLGEQRPLQGQVAVMSWVQGHPAVDLRRQQRNRDEEEGHPRESQAGQVLAEAADSHRPARIKQVMHHHQERGPQHQAQVEHERQ